MYKSISLFTSLLFALNTNAQSLEIPTEVVPFIPAGYAALMYEAGDINADQRPDGLLVLKNAAEDTSKEEFNRPLVLLIRQPDGSLKQVIKNDSAIMCKQCGGVFGDPLESLDANKNGFGLNFYGGSNWRWAVHYSFLYDPAQANWHLDNETHMSYLSSDPESSKDYTIKAAELGAISIAKFNTNQYDQSGEWQVTAARTYFYDNPELPGKHRKGYLIKGDQVTGYRELKNFVRVSYTNSKQETSHGFLLKKDMKRLK